MKRNEEKGLEKRECKRLREKEKNKGNKSRRKALLERWFTREPSEGDSQKGTGIHLLLHLSETPRSLRSAENPA